MGNLSRAKKALLLGLLMAVLIPPAAILDQKRSEWRRKQNIQKDRERIETKLAANPELHFKADMSLPKEDTGGTKEKD